MKKVTEKRLDEKMVLIASACAKMFVGDVVEKGTVLSFSLQFTIESLRTHTQIKQRKDKHSPCFVASSEWNLQGE